MLLRLAYLGVTNVFALLRLLPSSDRDKDIEILALRHQITVLERQLGKTRPHFLPSDRAFMATLMYRLPRHLLGRFRLLVWPDTVLRLAPRPAHAPPRGPVTPEEPGPTAHRPLHPAAGARLARENPCWGYLSLPCSPVSSDAIALGRLAAGRRNICVWVCRAVSDAASRRCHLVCHWLQDIKSSPSPYLVTVSRNGAHPFEFRSVDGRAAGRSTPGGPGTSGAASRTLCRRCHITGCP